MCAKFLLRFGSKNKVLKPYRMFFDLSRSSDTHENNLIKCDISVRDAMHRISTPKEPANPWKYKFSG